MQWTYLLIANSTFSWCNYHSTNTRPNRRKISIGYDHYLANSNFFKSLLRVVLRRSQLSPTLMQIIIYHAYITINITSSSTAVEVICNLLIHSMMQIIISRVQLKKKTRILCCHGLFRVSGWLDSYTSRYMVCYTNLPFYLNIVSISL